MAIKHGIYATEAATAVSIPVAAESGIPFVIGTAPVQAAASPASVGTPVLCTNWNEFVERFGYSDDWKKYTLCEFAYSHFKLYGRQPAIFCNLLAPDAMKTSVEKEDKAVIAHRITLPLEAILDSSLVIKSAGGESEAYIKGTDYSAFYTEDGLVIETLPGGSIYDAGSLSVEYNAVATERVDGAAVAVGLENIELCSTALGVLPDLIVAPGFSQDATVAAVMATKADSINGMFKAVALIDLDVKKATSYTAAITGKNANAHSGAEILCWPMVTLGGRTFHLSTHLAGLIAQVDTDNDGCPVESPSNKALKCDGAVLDDGSEINLTHAQAVALDSAGIVTALNFMAGFVAWGNHTAACPDVSDVKDAIIPIKRMFAWVNNTVIRNCWERLDKPMTRRFVDSIVDNLNVWLNGLTGVGFLLGGRVEYREDENSMQDLMNGICKFHIFLTPPSPAQEIDFVMEYDADYVTAAFSE